MQVANSYPSFVNLKNLPPHFANCKIDHLIFSIWKLTPHFPRFKMDLIIFSSDIWPHFYCKLQNRPICISSIETDLLIFQSKQISFCKLPNVPFYFLVMEIDPFISNNLKFTLSFFKNQIRFPILNSLKYLLTLWSLKSTSIDPITLQLRKSTSIFPLTSSFCTFWDQLPHLGTF